LILQTESSKEVQAAILDARKDINDIVKKMQLDLNVILRI
jgi:hypothetical protein